MPSSSGGGGGALLLQRSGSSGSAAVARAYSAPRYSVWRALWSRPELAKDVGGIVLITGSLLVYGVLQERIMTIGFGPRAQEELFEHSLFLVLCNRLVTCLLAFALVALTGADVKPAAPIRSYCTVSCTNVLATACQYEALKYVSFAVQTLAKSAKAFPVMLWGAIVSGKRYKPAEYLHAGAICLGCTIFVMGGNPASRAAAAKAMVALGASSSSTTTTSSQQAGAGGGGGVLEHRAAAAGAVVHPRGLAAIMEAATGGALEGSSRAAGPGGHVPALTLAAGVALMALYLVVDGLTSTQQDRMFNTYQMTIFDQVLYTTGFSTLFSFVGVVAAGQLLSALSFMLRHPDALGVVLALSASSACVQLIISYTIKRYGALVFATIMTTRQFFSILLSSLVFWTPLTGTQWVGLAVVFGTMYTKLARGGGGPGGRGAGGGGGGGAAGAAASGKGHAYAHVGGAGGLIGAAGAGAERAASGGAAAAFLLGSGSGKLAGSGSAGKALDELGGVGAAAAEGGAGEAAALASARQLDVPTLRVGGAGHRAPLAAGGDAAGAQRRAPAWTQGWAWGPSGGKQAGPQPAAEPQQRHHAVVVDVAEERR